MGLADHDTGEVNQSPMGILQQAHITYTLYNGVPKIKSSW